MIKRGIVGRIVSGHELGSYVKVEELPDDPPSFLILTASDREFREGSGDSWVEDYASLEQFFEESRWVIEWEE
ncbi:hypothetical protein RM780_00565 [Streptomyces sp. DSM 44917]|uniref:Uncharacterized protein n=1 Tax=Streptomyces boetiae TaxID=3075541 RepID=A0ABU2L296_9ACTN|nr:hypothetical protein [Streptomyces sp. DSM 44917]MDT0305458.1 hypothetical protein [Streptomyces sp. DSM 44917]